MRENSIIIDKLTKIYLQKNSKVPKYALKELNLKVPSGCILGLLGPNGAGKSTLINILGGVTIKTSGSLLVKGFDIDKDPMMFKTQIGVVPQEIVLDSFFSIHETLRFTSGYYGIKPNDSKIHQILEAVGLLNKRDSLPKQLSGGMKRRFLLAKAMIHSPSILILDEPTAGVDIELREQLWNYIRGININNKITIVITTHYLEEAEQLCNYFAFIDNGKIVFQGSKKDLLNNVEFKFLEVESNNILNNDQINIINQNYKVEYYDSKKITFKIRVQDNFNSILHCLLNLNIEVQNLRVIKPNIENIFKKLIKIN